MFSSISNLFNGTAKPTESPAPAPVNSQVTPGNIPNAPTPVPTPVDAAPVNSPLDQFNTLWEPVVNKGEEVNSQQALDPVKLQELVGKANFSSAISQENLSRIAQGGEEAQKAFAESMNSVAQQVMVQALLASNKMTETAVSNVNKAWETKLPELLRKQTLSENLRDSNPIYSNPAVRPVIEAVQHQLAAKNPNATPAELQVMSNNFVKAMSEAFNPAQVDTAKTKDEFDWEKFLAQPE